MFLLNRQKVIDARRRGALRIGSFDDAGLKHTFYYFRLGERYERKNRDVPGTWEGPRFLESGQSLAFEPRECVRVQSKEAFALGPSLLGVFGGNTELGWRGFALIHGPFVDPLYPQKQGNPDPDDVRPLDLVIVNNCPTEEVLEVGERIGKLAFFEISDTYPVELAGPSVAGGLFDERGERRVD